MPALPIIDTHVHLWDPQRLSYAWQKGNALIDRPYRVEDYQRDSRGIDTEALVFLECNADAGQSIAEIEFVEDEAKRDPRIMAIVPIAPLERGSSVAPLLEQMVTRFPRVSGIRRIVEFDANPRALMLSPAFIKGVSLLEKFDLHFEITVKHTQMDLVLEFVRLVPNVRMILDHCGKPGIKGGHIEVYRRQMTQLARHSDIVCKLSGLTTEADREHWTEADLRPFIDATLATFGPERIIYGGDWPVCLQATSLQRWVDVVDQTLDGLSESDLRSIYRNNAIRFYRLGLPII